MIFKQELQSTDQQTSRETVRISIEVMTRIRVMNWFGYGGREEQAVGKERKGGPRT